MSTDREGVARECASRFYQVPVPESIGKSEQWLRVADYVLSLGATEAPGTDLPTGDEAHGFEGRHRLAAALAYETLDRSGALSNGDENAIIVYLAQLIANYENRGRLAAPGAPGATDARLRQEIETTIAVIARLSRALRASAPVASAGTTATEGMESGAATEVSRVNPPGGRVGSRAASTAGSGAGAQVQGQSAGPCDRTDSPSHTARQPEADATPAPDLPPGYEIKSDRFYHWVMFGGKAARWVAISAEKRLIAEAAWAHYGRAAYQRERERAALLRECREAIAAVAGRGTPEPWTHLASQLVARLDAHLGSGR